MCRSPFPATCTVVPTFRRLPGCSRAPSAGPEGRRLLLELPPPPLESGFSSEARSQLAQPHVCQAPPLQRKVSGPLAPLGHCLCEGGPSARARLRLLLCSRRTQVRLSVCEAESAPFMSPDAERSAGARRSAGAPDRRCAHRRARGPPVLSAAPGGTRRTEGRRHRRLREVMSRSRPQATATVGAAERTED